MESRQRDRALGNSPKQRFSNIADSLPSVVLVSTQFSEFDFVVHSFRCDFPISAVKSRFRKFTPQRLENRSEGENGVHSSCEDINGSIGRSERDRPIRQRFVYQINFDHEGLSIEERIHRGAMDDTQTCSARVS